jgi:hypothetical protein
VYAERKHRDADQGSQVANLVTGLVITGVALWASLTLLRPADRYQPGAEAAFSTEASRGDGGDAVVQNQK